MKLYDNLLKRKLKAGEVCIGTVVTMNDPVAAELLSDIGFDWLWFDLEHTSMSLETLQTMLQATNGSGVTTLVRVPGFDELIVKRVLDLGPDGIIFPLVSTKEEAETAVKFCKYPPRGIRGAGFARAQQYGKNLLESIRTGDERTAVILFVESIEGVNNIHEIARVKDVDAILTGALDMSGSMDIGWNTFHPDVEAAMQAVAAGCKKANVPSGIMCMAPQGKMGARQRIEEGFQMIVMGIDLDFLRRKAEETLTAIKSEE